MEEEKVKDMDSSVDDSVESQKEMHCIDYKKEKWIKHYSSSHKILLVGEGDFSFAACLAEAFGSAENIVATCLDSIESLVVKYSRAAANIKRLEDLGSTIVPEVDALYMRQHPLLHDKLFDRIVFNFPHAGFDLFQSEYDSSQIKLHQKLVKGFLKTAYKMVSKDGEVHVTHKTSYPFSEWKIETLAKNVGLRLVEEAWFSIYHYPGYINKRGVGSKVDQSFPVGECSTFKFGLP